MLSKQELEETIILNALLTQRIQGRDDLQEALSAHGLINHNSPMPNYIKALVCSLETRFKKLNVKLLHAGAVFASIYRITDEAKLFAEDKLITAVYNEEGVIENCYYQHPIAIGIERRMLI
tara:strand:+ start:812 stop:1174 length:363 start_codon:yes stop_codon:yes gene_type:complete